MTGRISPFWLYARIYLVVVAAGLAAHRKAASDVLALPRAAGRGYNTRCNEHAYRWNKGERVPRRRKQDIVASLGGIASVIAMLVVFIAILMVLIILERLVLG
ncbi:MAG: hypothetical protein LBC23_00860 [Coriobacteriales bacterium]|jgi:hypothetical protein|nr:hypothetical protein [Coriobacteriales bacterium]